MLLVSIILTAITPAIAYENQSIVAADEVVPEQASEIAREELNQKLTDEDFKIPEAGIRAPDKVEFEAEGESGEGETQESDEIESRQSAPELTEE